MATIAIIGGTGYAGGAIRDEALRRVTPSSRSAAGKRMRRASLA